MKEMIIMMAKIMPKEEILTEMQDAITEYKLFEKEEDMKKLILYSQIISLKVMMELEGLSISDVMKDIEDTEHVHNMIKKSSNN